LSIRWSALRVSEAADMAEEFVNQAVEPLEQVRVVAREALKIENIPEYMQQYFYRLISEVDRVTGGTHYEPVGRLKSSIEAIRDNLPSGTIEAEREKLKHGSQKSLIE